MKTLWFYWGVAGALVAATVVTHIVGATQFPDWWGAHFYRFLPRPALWVGCALVALGSLAAWRAPAWLDRTLARLLKWGPGRSVWWWRAGGALLALYLLWTFRERHTFLGDGNPLTQNLPRGQRFHPDEPLALILHHAFYQLTHRFFEIPGKDPADVARDTVGLSSVIAGALFVPVAWGLSRDIAQAHARVTEPECRGDSSESVLLFLVLVAQGYVQLFFGYVENYTVYLLVLAGFVLAALRCLAGRAPLLLPGALLIVALALHLSAAVLLPSFGVLMGYAATRPARRLAVARDLGLCACLFALVHFALASFHPGYSWGGMLLSLPSAATSSGSSYGFSPPNLFDVLNQQMLTGPMGVFLFLPAVGAGVIGGAHRNPRNVFLITLGAGYLVASFIAGDSNLGVARNWDLLAPAGFVFTLAAMDLATQASWQPAELRRWLFILAMISAFHTVPWIAVNASFDRALDRFKTLPLGRGRTQAVVGSWYLVRGQEREAVLWFRRALDENPGNNLAAFELGRIAMRHDDYEFACRAFYAALRVRPSMEQYRLAFADALVRSGHLQWARPELDTLLTRNPREPAYWAASSIVWLGLGERDSSAAALEQADRLVPGDSTLAALRLHLAGQGGYAQAVKQDWPAVTVPRSSGDGSATPQP